MQHRVATGAFLEIYSMHMPMLALMANVGTGCLGGRATREEPLNELLFAYVVVRGQDMPRIL